MEKERLDALFNVYQNRNVAWLRKMSEFVVKTFKPFINHHMVGLQLGYGGGYESKLLCQNLNWLEIIEGSEECNIVIEWLFVFLIP